MHGNDYPLVRNLLLGSVFFSFTSVGAYMKGFHVRYWMLAAGPRDLLVLAFLPSAAAPHLTCEWQQRLLKRADQIGLALSGFGVVFQAAWCLRQPRLRSGQETWFQAPSPRGDGPPM
jgi:hypothetical protein